MPMKPKVTKLPAGPEDATFQEYQFDERLGRGTGEVALDNSARSGYNNTWNYVIAQQLANAPLALARSEYDELYILIEGLL